MVDEAYIEMRCYIKYSLYYGQNEEIIKQALIKSGWPLEMINKAFLEVKGVKRSESPKAAVPQQPLSR
ncbi:MAG TPA: hypothetical protein HA362_05785 [Nanoarchaeota archaeon]|nr:hypothetical protein [Nanoarchaeota archaeon]